MALSRLSGFNVRSEIRWYVLGFPTVSLATHCKYDRHPTRVEIILHMWVNREKRSFAVVTCLVPCHEVITNGFDMIISHPTLDGFRCDLV